MKRLLLLFCTLLFVVSGVWAISPAAGAYPVEGKQYYIFAIQNSGARTYLYNSSNSLALNQGSKENTDAYKWTVTVNNGKYTIKSVANTSYYLGVNSVLALTTTSKEWTLGKTVRDAACVSLYYDNNEASEFTGGIYYVTNSSGTTVSSGMYLTSKNGTDSYATNNGWTASYVFEEVLSTPTLTANTCYRIYNNNDSKRYYYYNGSALATTETLDLGEAYAWKYTTTTVSEVTYANLQNMKSSTYLGHKGMSNSAYNLTISTTNALYSGNLTIYSVAASKYQSIGNTGDFGQTSTKDDKANSTWSTDFYFIPLKKVTFSSAVTVNDGSAVSTIYVAQDGSDALTLQNDRLYVINGTKYTPSAAAAEIKNAGTTDIEVTVLGPANVLENNKLYRLVQYWDQGVPYQYTYYVYGSSTADDYKLCKTTTAPSVTNGYYIWKAVSNESYWYLQNNSKTNYISKAEYTSKSGSAVTPLSATSTDDAESFNILTSYKTGYVVLQAMSQSTATYLDSYGISGDHGNYVGWHTGGNPGEYFKFIPVKTVTFSTAVAVNGGDAVSTIYVATDGSDSFSLPANYKYTIGGVEMNGLQAATTIAAAGTSDISVTVSSPILVNDQKYRIQQTWTNARYSLYANTSDGSNGNRLWKRYSASTTTLLTDANYIWQAKSSDSNWKLYNPAANSGAGRYIAKATSTSVDGSGVNALNASSADDAEIFTLVSAESCGYPPSDYSSKCYVALKSNNQTDTYLNSYSSNGNYVGWHNAVHAGYYFSFIPVKTVNFIDEEEATFAVAVNGESVSTIYVATDGSDTFTLPSSYLYSINGTEAVINTEAVEVIVAAGTSDITVTVSDNPSRNVTYNLKWKNTDITSVEDVTTYVSAPASEFLPSSMVRDFVEFTYSPTEIASNTEEVTVTASWTGPFEIFDTFGDIDDDDWSDMSVRSTWYVTSDLTDGDGALSTVNANALGLATDPYQWAFVGNPYSLKLYNKDKGEDYVYAWTSAENKNIPTFVSAATGNTWTIKASTASGYTNAFLLTIPEYGYQVNQFGGAGGSLKIWNSTATNDAGSAFKIFDVPDEFADYVTSEIAPYMENSATVFNWTSAARTAIGYDEAYKTTCTYDQYKTMKERLLAKLADQSSFTLPESGKYYSVRNVGTSKYLSIGGANGTLGDGCYNVLTSSSFEPSSIIKVTTSNSHPYFNGQNLQYSWASASPNATTGNARAEAEGKYAYYYVTTPGQGAIAFVLGNGEDSYSSYTANSYYRDNGSGVVIGGTYDANNAQWIMEEVTSVTIPLNVVDDKSYATMYLPFGVTLPAANATGGDVCAYTLTDLGNGWVRPVLLGSDGKSIPAGTAVLISGTSSTSVTATIEDVDDIDEGDNLLRGTYVSIAPGDNLVLGKIDGVAGFYKYNYNIKPNKAFIPAALAPGIKGFIMDFDDMPTGINGIANGQANGSGAIYNIAGQRVANPVRGLYIVNGKKVMVK